MFKWLFYAHLGITALLIYSWLSLFFLSPGARDGRWSNKLDTGLVVLLFSAIAGLIWYLKSLDKPETASFVLYGFYGLAACWLLWLMKNATWH